MNGIVIGFMVVVTTLFALYAQGVRRAILPDRFLVPTGIGIGAFALLGMLMILSPGLKRGLPIPALLVNVIAMALCTAYCIVMAQRQSRVEEIATAGKLSALVTTAFRLPPLDALIVPTSTHLRTFGGPAALLLVAGGKGLEAEIKKSPPVNLDKVVSTGPGALKVRKLWHVALHAPAGSMEAAKLRKGLQAALLAARKDGAKTVGLSFGMLRGVPEAEAAAIYLQAAKKYEDDFEKIVLVLLEGRGEATFKAAFAPTEPATPSL